MRDEYINALQNIGASLFVLGIALNRVVEPITQLVLYIISVVLMVVGIALISVVSWVTIEEHKREEQKNKCHRTAKHIDTYH